MKFYFNSKTLTFPQFLFELLRCQILGLGTNVKKMRGKNNFYCVKNSRNNAKSSNVKSSKKYEHFGETTRYLTLDELQQFFDSIDNYSHKLMFRVNYELGCRVGEFVRIRVKHLDFSRSTVFFPAANTKTKHARTSYLPKGLMNEVRSVLKQKIYNSLDEPQIDLDTWIKHYNEERAPSGKYCFGKTSMQTFLLTFEKLNKR